MHNSRIDLWLVSSSLNHMVDSCYIKQSPAPDHKAVILELRTHVKSRGKGYWKMNVSVLDDNNYIQSITPIIQTTMDEYGNFVSRSQLWEYIKSLVKKHTIKYCVMKANARRDQIAELELKIDKLDQDIKVTKCPKLYDERKKMKLDLDNLYKDKCKGYQIRSRAKWVEQGESSSAYFCNLEKGRQSSNCILSLKDKSGLVKTSDAEILSVAHEFYQELYATKHIANEDIDAYLNNLTPENKLSDLQKEACEGEITLDECALAVTKMKNNKAPGLDGLCIEFYKKMWPVIGKLLVEAFNESYSIGKLPLSQRSAVMSLIFKRGDQEEIGNYRPVSLTNVDYRILAFVLSRRMQNVISCIVNTDQTAYIKGRYMGQNIRLLSDIVDVYSSNNKQGMIMALDFAKAFDNLEWNFVLKVMEFFNFGESLMAWIKLLYNEPQAQLKNNGHLSEDICMSRGIRQVCPVSAILFILAAEILAIKIRSSNSLQGILIGSRNKCVKISQYADDGILYINSKEEICCALNILSDFGRAAGVILNVSKCEGLWFENSVIRQFNKAAFGITWKKSIRCLGIYIGQDEDMNHQKNWFEKLENIRTCLSKWKSRDLTLFGKVQVIKILALPQIILSATLLHLPQDIISELNKIFFGFVWGKKDKLKRVKVIQEKSHGGLGMVDVMSLFDSFKASWIYRIKKADPERDNWVQISNSIISQLGGLDVLQEFNFEKVQKCLIWKNYQYFTKMYLQLIAEHI